MHDAERRAVVTAQLVGASEPVERVDDDAEENPARDRRSGVLGCDHHVAHRDALEVFDAHHELAVDHVEVDGLSDVRMMDARRHLRLPPEGALVDGAVALSRIEPESLQDDERPPVFRVERQREIDAAHAARAEGLNGDVLAEHTVHQAGLVPPANPRNPETRLSSRWTVRIV